ncbi:hypothetical protein D9611_007917 [Ephemerocybe angulata]|uniref:Uncharacterized protein n=1 Tax=Ephemerocybe angulata TaxID=980116 RepID=A0A8H5CGH8_9AGAR|nr:hypothetical protein D9611_007917 [Tulosesus angulatus]
MVHRDMEAEEDKFRFHDLPEDLVRSVFEASADDPVTPQWAWARVSKAVQSWVEPILYRHITVRYSFELSRLHRTIVSHPSKPPDFFASKVKTLSICTRARSGETLAIEVLSACPNVSSLEMDVHLPENERDDLKVGNHPIWEQIRPTRLWISGTMFTPPHRHFKGSLNLGSQNSNLNPMFMNLSHLELNGNSTTNLTAWSWPSLASVPTLTHLCVSLVHRSENIAAIYSQLYCAVPSFPPSLSVCVFSITFSQWLTEAPQLLGVNIVPDPRVLIAVDESDCRGDQEGGSAGAGLWFLLDPIWRYRKGDKEERRKKEESFWNRAEEKVAERIRTVNCS